MRKSSIWRSPDLPSRSAAAGRDRSVYRTGAPYCLGKWTFGAQCWWADDEVGGDDRAWGLGTEYALAPGLVAALE
ncbi:MAG TPA: hypothetical protein VEH84_09810 [Alphaproteobacteria bacterium]|nr:hypothetical protein [Alphaproteobacteria bacterium]